MRTDHVPSRSGGNAASPIEDGPWEYGCVRPPAFRSADPQPMVHDVLVRLR